MSGPRGPLSHRKRVSRARLARTPGVGSPRVHRLLEQHRRIDDALDALPRLSKGRLTPPSADAVGHKIEMPDARGARLIARCAPDDPPLPAPIDPRQPMMSVRGAATLSRKALVAMVDAREASAAGQIPAARCAREPGELGELDELGFVVSGMARGIDARVHDASPETGAIAVLVFGLDRPCPPHDLVRHAEICAQGVVGAEALREIKARARDGPRRNQIISGMSPGVVVTAAGQRSGALVAARTAGEQGREAMAVPGSPRDPRPRDARVEKIAHRPSPTPGLSPTPVPSPTPVHVNDLARLVKEPAGVAAGAVMALELQGRTAFLPGATQRRPARPSHRPSAPAPRPPQGSNAPPVSPPHARTAAQAPGSWPRRTRTHLRVAACPYPDRSRKIQP